MKISNTLIVLILFTLSFSSCKKPGKDVLSRDALTGAWEELPTQSTSRTLIFEPGGKFTSKLKMKGSNDWFIMVSGTYATDADNVIVNITEEQERDASGKITKTPVNFRYFDKGKFNIQNFVLTIDYKTYPADAPVDTQAKFNKILPID
ncbi:hypothetical protein [Pedobacter jejuensis]|uniref:Lipocalin-like domain-containing protein n=1 Tax=Pedobacter jejuensis TaxID=1268550 RepID=A0A3N0BXP2_9SPHI|nr:hypothetical protein [Pedobacter jejuensis]RNL54527.1 hypothetical protein D7004_06965 [Pedobacter jejuensis]